MNTSPLPLPHHQIPDPSTGQPGRVTPIPAPRPESGLNGNPRILFVTPEISYVAPHMCPGSECIRAKAGGLADVSASLVEHLRAIGADIHLALPHYRNLFRGNRPHAEAFPQSNDPESRVHLAEDEAFHCRINAYHGDLHETALAFQREVINHIIPAVQPDIVHCHDWMTGLIPAACKKLGIKTVFTIHNIHRELTTLAELENHGIDPSHFWESLHYHGYPYCFYQSYRNNTIDLLSSAIINADYVTTVSPTFLQEIIHGKHGDLPDSVRQDLVTKINAGYAGGILNAPDPHFSPDSDPSIVRNYGSADHREGKRANKIALQEMLGLSAHPEAPVLFWPSRLDPVQKGCQLLTEILYQIMSSYEDDHLQLVVIGDGPFKVHFQDIVSMHQLQDRVAVRDFHEPLSHQAFAGSDFVLMPSSFEPCGLPQMIGARYGTIPIAHNTGGLHDTVHMFTDHFRNGNGIVFDHFDGGALHWAIDRAIDFHHSADDIREATITRIMQESARDFSNDKMLSQYDSIYDKLNPDRSTKA